jgi:hypothetical protein
VASEKRFSKMFHPGSFWFIAPLLVIRLRGAGGACCYYTYVHYMEGRGPKSSRQDENVGKSFAAAVGLAGAEIKFKLVNAGGSAF